MIAPHDMCWLVLVAALIVPAVALPWTLVPFSWVYDVRGHVSIPSLIQDGEISLDLEVFVEPGLLLGDGSRADNAHSRLMVLSLGRESLIRDGFGSPIPHWIDHDMLTFPMLFRWASNGTITEVFYHVDDSTRSVRLKRALVSALQLTHVEPLAPPARPVKFSAMEEDTDGPAWSDYTVRRGFIGRTTYLKRSTYGPTKRRPPEIVQRTDAVAIIGGDGTLLRLKTSLHFGTNFSGRPDGDTDEIRRNITGLDQLPRDPSTYMWRLRRPDESGAYKRTRRRLQSDLQVDLDESSFVCSPLRVSEEEADTGLERCAAFIREATVLLQRVVDIATDESTRFNSSKKLVHGAMACPVYTNHEKC